MSRRAPLLLGVLSLTCGAVEWDAPNQTVVRERFEHIVTIDGDLRRTAEPAMPWPAGWGEVILSYQHSTVAWTSSSLIAQAAAQPPHGDEVLTEARDEATITWRQNLGTPWLTLETKVHGVREDRTPDDYHLGDLETNFVIPLYFERYHAVALSLGALTPLVDEGSDWITSHGMWSDASWTARVGVRGSFGIQLATLQVHVTGYYTPHGSNKLPHQEKRIENSYLALDAGVGVTYRLTRFLRVDADQSYVNRSWRDHNDQTTFSFHQISAPLLGRLEVSPNPGLGLYLEGWAGTDLATRDQLDPGDRLVVGGSFTWVY
ncbi:MAG TPA: hypothetical protein VHX44_04465 [Planctomycetota bacterium]|nr:hypothetical protein [Planctomycetota bacterium]